MPRIERDYHNLKETERIWEAVHRTNTHIKDYSLRHLISVLWRIDRFDSKDHLNRLKIGKNVFIGHTHDIKKAVHVLVERQDHNDWLPRAQVKVDGTGNDMYIDTRSVNWECLRDHVAQVTIGDATAVVDLEELLKATRYA